MSEKCPLCGKSDRALFGALYIRLFGVANTNNQLVGEDNDLFVTLEQVHSAMLKINEEETAAHGAPTAQS